MKNRYGNKDHFSKLGIKIEKDRDPYSYSGYVYTVWVKQTALASFRQRKEAVKYAYAIKARKK